MTGRRRSGRRAVCALAAGLLALQGLTGCGSPDTAERTDGDTRSVQRVLDRWSAAVREHDEKAYLAAVDPQAPDYRADRQRVFARLAAVPLASWEYRLVRTGGFAPAPGPGRRIAAEAELRYRLDGYDSAPVVVPVRLTFAGRGGRWYVAAGDPAGQQLWEQGDVTAVRGAHSLVLGSGQDRARLQALADLADRAVPAVDTAWRGTWAGRVVIEMPASLDRMAALLGAPAANYRGIAAVTTGEVGGTAAAPADRIVVNPEAYGVLGEFGRRIVLTHETAHVATRAATSGSTPLWLSEGFADWAAYRGTGRTARQAAPELADAVAAGKGPQQLPADGDFGFTGEAGRLARAYEGGWLACRMIAEKWSEAKLVDVYRAFGRKRPAKEVLRKVLGVSPDEFTARWRAYVAGQFGR
ncbi:MULTISPECIES: hypothetical protein [Streptomyces]|uniref:hypothetical protein n=1 Tax=Streptomyces TaxID=1883 RepID=UPI001D0F5C2D|nr:MULTISPECIES: hypothetical protein [Streptomyces]MCC2277079.1 hypothetical protein [Streptomyces sp. ET3-23]